jgi:GTP cyclohydrolase I
MVFFINNSGYIRKAFMPMALACSAVTVSLYPVHKITGMSGLSRIMDWASSAPVIFGIV